MTNVTYQCSNCLDHAVTRDFDVSHLSRSCDACGEFARFVHGGVLAKYREFEKTVPDGLDWERLSRIEKFAVAEGIVRQGRAVADYDVESADEESVDGEATDEESADEESVDGEATDEESADEESADGETADAV